VAIKVLASQLSASADVREPFEREAPTISQLSHPHICALYDVGEAPNPESNPESRTWWAPGSRSRRSSTGRPRWRAEATTIA